MTAAAGGGERIALGAAGEEAAARSLAAAGLAIVARRFRSRCGEIDLVARDGAVVVFVEVKTRRGVGFGTPAEAVTPRKQARLVRAARLFLLRAGWSERPCRFDVVEVEPRGDAFAVRHVRDAFRPSD